MVNPQPPMLGGCPEQAAPAWPTTPGLSALRRVGRLENRLKEMLLAVLEGLVLRARP